MDWVRARSDEQIEQRVSEIVDATARLYKEHRFEEITFAMIAKEADFTRSNLYRYFETKEDIFLELLSHDIEIWRNHVLETFPDEFIPAQEFAERWVNLLLEHARLIKLFTILYTMLERNASMEALVAFKQKTLGELGIVSEKLSKVLPFTALEAIGEFLNTQTALTLGSYPVIDLAPRQKEAMEAVGMDTNPEVYKDMLIHATESLVQGLTNSEE
jgi:AcrR family transcriptional regulator